MIAKQYLITGIFWDDYRCRVVYAFRMQLAWPESFILIFMGDNLL
jgi:hypothetical protein